MSKADLGKIYKEKAIKDGIVVYFTEMMSSMYLVLAEDSQHQIIFSRTYPFTEGSREKQRKLARNAFNSVRYRLANDEDLEVD